MKNEKAALSRVLIYICASEERNNWRNATCFTFLDTVKKY